MGSRLAVPSHIRTEDKQRASWQDIAKQLPKPTGYKVLISLWKPEKTTEGGIIKAEQTLQAEEVGSIIGRVLELGPDAYSDKQRYPSGAYCKRGDYIMMRAYAGTRFKFRGKEFRLVNDDTVEAVINDPRGFERV